MAKNPWFPLYVSDYLSKTTGLTAELHGAYLLLLMAYWVRGGPLPDDDSQLAEMTRITGKRWLAARKVLEQFFTIADGVWRNKRMDEEIAEAGERFERRSKAGRMNRQRATNGQPMVDQQGDHSYTHPHPHSHKEELKDLDWGEDGPASALKPRFDTVRGGAKRFAGLGDRPFQPKNPDRADADLVKHLTTHCGMDAGEAWTVVAAARDPAHEKHSEMARFCEKESRNNKIGWFHADMEAAE